MNATPPLFDWAEYLRLATQLSQNSDEASHRTSISRAYYSIFHAATVQAQRNGYAGRSHKKLWAIYQSDADRNCRKLSTIGNTMKVAREDADYVTAVSDIPDTMTQQITDANDFIAILGALPPTSPKV
jgi:uncharacterized protein (UPF0332 family)